MRFFPHKPSILPPFMEPPIWHYMARKYICFLTPRGSVPLGILRGFCKLSGHRLKQNVFEFPWIDVNRSVFLKAAFASQNAYTPPRYWTNTCSKATTRLKFQYGNRQCRAALACQGKATESSPQHRPSLCNAQSKWSGASNQTASIRTFWI